MVLALRSDIINEESAVNDVLVKALEQDGIGFHFHSQVEKVAHVDGVFKLTLSTGKILEGEALLIATGRKPNTKALNAEATGVELDDRGYIKIDEHFHTTCNGVYAIGDASGQPAFTHVS